MTIVKCNVCFQKKSQRNCPALQQLICPTCCGEHKEKVQDCPKDCIYLIESEMFKDEKYREEMIAKTDRVKRDTVNGEEKYTEFIDGIEKVVYEKVWKDENFEDEHIITAFTELTDNYMSRKLKIIEEEEDVQLNRVGTLKSDIMDFIKSVEDDEDKEFEKYEFAGCLDMFKLMVEAQKASSLEEDKRAYINSLIDSKKEGDEETPEEIKGLVSEKTTEETKEESKDEQPEKDMKESPETPDKEDKIDQKE